MHWRWSHRLSWRPSVPAALVQTADSRRSRTLEGRHGGTQESCVRTLSHPSGHAHLRLRGLAVAGHPNRSWSSKVALQLGAGPAPQRRRFMKAYPAETTARPFLTVTYSAFAFLRRPAPEHTCTTTPTPGGGLHRILAFTKTAEDSGPVPSPSNAPCAPTTGLITATASPRVALGVTRPVGQGGGTSGGLRPAQLPGSRAVLPVAVDALNPAAAQRAALAVWSCILGTPGGQASTMDQSQRRSGSLDARGCPCPPCLMMPGGTEAGQHLGSVPCPWSGTRPMRLLGAHGLPPQARRRAVKLHVVHP